ncbi:hypothetical protein [Streptomyces sp. NBC_01190]|uniref:hypothetical protein n=1 Tax=Streptomyces sp. NBC_01190 TaxID=2903767 RepID=UPI0038630BB5|nr:hypothetical protein OG519_18675 [Streptomyces sp. NBC_01190]
MGATDDATELKRRADTLRECATQARTIARSLGPYLDAAVSKAAPRGGESRSGAGGSSGDSSGGATGGNPAIWAGPFADQCTHTLMERQSKLAAMASALLTDSVRWESEATRLEGEAKAAKNATSTVGGR